MKSERLLAARGWTPLYHDCEISGVQVDLLMRSPSGVLTVVEVKSETLSGLAHLPWRQQRRLFRVVELLSGWEPCELQLALVRGSNLRLLPVDALTAR